MKRLMLMTLAGLAALALSGAASSATASKTICVGNKLGCYSSLQAGLNAASDGDTIKVMPGTYAGGVTVDKSVALVGSGAGVTSISGGGPVLTIGVLHAATEPTVSITGLTVRDGLTTSSFGSSGSRAAGGGIQIPPNAACTGGATVQLTNSVVTDNTAQPSTGGTDVGPCPASSLHYALASGGGIYNGGALTITNSTVSDNTAGGGGTSNAWGGGILSNPQGSSLTIVNSTISGNQATVSDPNGEQSTGGGILAQTGAFTLTNSSVTGNSATLTSSTGTPPDTFQANSAGIQCDRSASITNTRIDGNTVSVSDPNSEPAAFDSGIGCGSSGGTLVMKNSSVSDNQVVANVADTTDSGPDGVALEFDGPGTVVNTRVTGNSTTVTSPAGAAQALGAVGGFQVSPDTVTIANSVISGNTVTASSTTGSATVQGAGLVNDGPMLLSNDQIASNRGTVSAPNGSGQGGGIFNGVTFGAPPVELTLQNTSVTGNALTGNSGITLQGGGLYTFGFPITSTNSHIADNAPDQCYGC